MNFFEQDLVECLENIANKLNEQSPSLLRQKSSSVFPQRISRNKAYCNFLTS